MRDGIISEQMKSRLIKAGLPATYEELVALAADTGIPADILFNEEGWRQLPTYLIKANLLSDATEIAIWENAKNRTVNDALKMLADVAYGRVASLTLTIKDTAGNPIPDVTVRLDSAPTVGTDPTTGTDGKIKLDTSGGTHTVYLVYPMGYSVESAQKSVQVTGNTSLTVSDAARRAETTVFTLTKAKTFFIARYLSPVQFDIRGGGGSGAVVAVSVSGYGGPDQCGGQGGAGGYVTLTGVVDVAGKLIRVYPGAGGASVSVSFPGYPLHGEGRARSSSGYRGGKTTLMVDSDTYTANGGAGGNATYGDSYKKLSQNTDGGAPGGGSVNRGTAEVNGSDGRYLFDDSASNRAGGGGGGSYAVEDGGLTGSGGQGGGTGGDSNSSASSSSNVKSDDASTAGGSGAASGMNASRYAGGTVTSGKGGPGFVAFRKAV